MKQIRKRLTYANVMSTIAVFLVLGGATALAAGQLGKNTVGTKQLKQNAVTAAKVKKEAITGAKIANGAVTATKLAAGAVGTAQLGKAAVTGEKLAANAVGPTNIADNAVTTTKLAAGSVTASKLGPITVETEVVPVPKNSSGSANVDCPPGQRAISGGGNWSAFIKGLSFLSSRPIRSSADNDVMADGQVAGGWRSSGSNESATEATSIQVYVLCAQ